MHGLRRHLPAARRGSRGRRAATTAVEFALVSPVFLMLLVLVIESAWQLAVDLALNIGTIAASRYGITGAGYAAGTRDGSIVAKAIAIAAGLLNPANLTTTTQSYASPASYASGGTATSSTGSSGQFVVYTYTYNAPYLTALPKTITGSASLAHSVTVLVQNEPF